MIKQSKWTSVVHLCLFMFYEGIHPDDIKWGWNFCPQFAPRRAFRGSKTTLSYHQSKWVTLVYSNIILVHTTALRCKENVQWNIPVFYFSLGKIEIWIDAHQKENVSQHYNPTVSNMNSCILRLKIFFINFQLSFTLQVTLLLLLYTLLINSKNLLSKFLFTGPYVSPSWLSR